ncbi:MAG: AAA family ATPase [Chloroflexi bacterium]|nr:AAA family ATPase [Chloroflexota bacterium]
MAPLWLKTLRVENFKRFETLELDFKGFNLLVGPNNSGKSTALQACALFNFCYQTCLDRRNGHLAFQNRTFGPDEFITVPAAEPLDLWKDRRAQRGNNAIPIRVKGELYSGPGYEFEVVLRFNRFSVQSVSDTPPLEQAFNITLIPGYTGFWPREERRTPAVRRDMRGQAQHGGIIRNLLLDLREDPQRWERFIQELAAIFPSIHLQRPEFDEQTDRYIRVGYTEGVELSSDRRRKTPELDLFSGGSGFHQFVQILSSILVEDATTVLLDEPDAHLFSKLQSDLFAVMDRLADGGIQIIAATHSTELVAAARPNQLITFANGEPRRLQVWPEVLNTVSALGGLENLSLLLIDAYRKVIIVEDKSDEQYLRLWLNCILGADRYKRIQRRLVFLYSQGRPTGDGVARMIHTLKQAFRADRPLDVKAFVVADRDYALAEQLAAERARYQAAPFVQSQTWRIWNRIEIENYLLAPDAIARAVVAAAVDQLPMFQPQPQDVVEMVEEIVAEAREPLRLRLINALSDYNRTEKLGWEAATITQRAEALLDSLWATEKRYQWCDAKEVVLPRMRERLRDQYQIQLADSSIITAMADAEIPVDLRETVEALAQFVGEG